MDSTIRSAILGASAPTRAAMIGSASKFITDTNLTNLLQNIDINNPKKFNYSLFAAFNSVPGLRQQVDNWIRGA
jgi:hypothetical protein